MTAVTKGNTSGGFGGGVYEYESGNNNMLMIQNNTIETDEGSREFLMADIISSASPMPFTGDNG